MAQRIEFEQTRPIHKPDFLEVAVGVIRFAIVLPGILFGAAFVALAAMIPVRLHGARPSSWVAVGLSRLFIRLFGIRLVCTDVEAMRNHAGLVFINHVSYLDPIIVNSLAPMRFLSTIGVKRLPVIGWIVRSMDTMFVHRGSLRSRAASRVEVTQRLLARDTPPIVIAPEGQIGPGDIVLPFRRGAFNIAADAGVSILPVVIQFDPPQDARWIRGEWILRAAWRLAARLTPFTATLTVLNPFFATPANEIQRIVSDTEALFNCVLSGATPSEL